MTTDNNLGNAIRTCMGNGTTFEQPMVDRHHAEMFVKLSEHLFGNVDSIWYVDRTRKGKESGLIWHRE